MITPHQVNLLHCSAAGPSIEVAEINHAIGAESAFTLQCKSMVHDYVPQIIAAIETLPLDAVRGRIQGEVFKM